jgi:hypothetical protein
MLSRQTDHPPSMPLMFNAMNANNEWKLRLLHE